MKIKKRTRAQILDRLYEISHDTSLVEKNILFDGPEKYITTVNILNKGETATEARCHKCGTKYIRERLWGCSYDYVQNEQMKRHFKCPSCGNDNVARDTQRHFEEKRHRLIVKNEDGFEFVQFTSYYQFNTGDDWYENEPAHHILITAAGIFDRKSGFYVATRSSYNRNEYKVLRRLSNDESSILFWLKDFTDSNVPDDECRELLEEGKRYYEEFRKESKAKSEKRQEKKSETERLLAEEREKLAELKRQEYEARRLADKRWTYEAKPIDLEAIFEHPIMCTLYSAPNGEDATYLVGCAKCGTVHEATGVEINNEYACPHCGNHVDHLIPSGSYYRDEASQTAIVFENTDFEENDLLIRVFRYQCEMSAQNGISKSVYESKRIFAGKEPSIYTKRVNGRFEQASDWDKLHVPSSENVIIPNVDRVVEIVQNSCLKYSGLIDSWGLGKCKYNWSIQMPNLSYLQAWYVNPTIELVMKSNLTHITEQFVENPEDMRSGTTLANVLGIDTNLVKTIVKMDPPHHKMRDMAMLYEADNTLTADIYEQIVRENLHRAALKNLVERYDLTYDKIMKYLQAAYDHQCILKSETLSIWSDYLRMASAVGVNLNDKSKKFPSSLKKEHDIVMFAYRAVQVEMDQRAFAEQAEINAKYEFETDDMMVIVPRTPQAVIEEANAQNNCLRSYVERVKRGETVVAFVRKKSDPDKTFLSAEIHNGDLIQLKGWCNSNPRTKEIVEFTKQWAKARNINIKC